MSALRGFGPLSLEALADALRRRIALAVAFAAVLSVVMLESCTSCSPSINVNGEVQDDVRAAGAALERLAAMPGVDGHHEVEDLRQAYHDRMQAIAELRAGVPRSSSLAEAAFKRARHETLAAERRALIELRDRGDISDEVLLGLEEELDREALRHGLAHIRPNR